MKILIVVLVMFCSGFVGYIVKSKYLSQLNLIKDMLDFLSLYKANLSFYHENLHEIILKYNINQKNKDTKNTLFQLNNGIFVPNYNIFSKIYNSDIVNLSKDYFSSLGSVDLFNENEKLDKFQKVLEVAYENTKVDLKQKGELWFKICLAVGAVIAIIIW